MLGEKVSQDYFVHRMVSIHMCTKQHALRRLIVECMQVCSHKIWSCCSLKKGWTVNARGFNFINIIQCIFKYLPISLDHLIATYLNMHFQITVYILHTYSLSWKFFHCSCDTVFAQCGLLFYSSLLANEAHAHALGRGKEFPTRDLRDSASLNIIPSWCKKHIMWTPPKNITLSISQSAYHSNK